MAQMLVRIARHKVIRDTKRTHQLPDSVTVLNLLAGLPPPVLGQALDAGVIHRNTTLEQAQVFLKERLTKASTPAAPQPQPQRT